MSLIANYGRCGSAFEFYALRFCIQARLNILSLSLSLSRRRDYAILLNKNCWKKYSTRKYCVLCVSRNCNKELEYQRDCCIARRSLKDCNLNLGGYFTGCMKLRNMKILKYPTRLTADISAHRFFTFAYRELCVSQTSIRIAARRHIVSAVSL